MFTDGRLIIARRHIYLARYIQPLLSYPFIMLMSCAQKKANIEAEMLYLQATRRSKVSFVKTSATRAGKLR